MEGKYIIFTAGLGPIPMLFAGSAKHADMMIFRKGLRLMSAGMFRTSVVDGSLRVECYGDSHTLIEAGFPPKNCVSYPAKDSAILGAVLGAVAP